MCASWRNFPADAIFVRAALLFTITAYAVIAQAAALSLSDVKMGARTSADEWEYPTLSDGLDRTKKTDHKWLVHFPTYPDIWADAERVKGMHRWTTTNRVYGGFFDTHHAKRYFHGIREWALQFHGHDISRYGAAGYYASPATKAQAYKQIREWWTGTGYRSNTGLANSFVSSDNFILAKVLWNYYHHYQHYLWPGKVDVIGSEMGENTNSSIHSAFGRGAARQSGLPWGADYSPWMAGRAVEFGGWWQTAQSDVDPCARVATGGGYVAWLDAGDFWVKAPGARRLFDRHGKFITDKTDKEYRVAQNVLGFAIGSTRQARFVVRLASEVKVVSHGAGFSTCCTQSTLYSQAVKRILDVYGTRVALLKNDGSVLVKNASGAENDVTYQGAYSKGWLDGSHVVLLKTDGTLGYEKRTGQLQRVLTSIDTNVRDAVVEGAHILYLKTNGNLYYKSDMTVGLSTLVRSDVSGHAIRDIALAKNGANVRIGVLYDNSELRVAATPAGLRGVGVLEAAHVQRFDMAGDRVAVLLEGSDGETRLDIKEGALNAEWIPMMWVPVADIGLSKDGTDEAIFVHTRVDEKILVKNSARLMDREWDSSPYKIYGGNGVLFGGHSESNFRNMYYFSYMAGASILYQEGGYVMFRMGPRTAIKVAPDRTVTGTSGPFTLGLQGVIAKRHYDFTYNTLTHDERGINWAPIALMLDHYHGLGDLQIQGHGNYSPFFAIARKNPDRMNIELLKTIWGQSPKRWPVGDTSNDHWERYHLANQPYGEIFDVLTDWAPADVIANYPVLFMSGEIRPDAAMRTKLTNYVNNGGNLVINSAMNVGQFPVSFTGATLATPANYAIDGLKWKIDDSTETFSSPQTVSAQQMTLSNGASALLESTNSTPRTLASIRTHGSGRVIVVAMPDLHNREILSFLLEKLSGDPAVNPFKITGDVMYLANYKGSDTWLVTLINNNGVSKHRDSRQVLTPGVTGVTLQFQEDGRDLSTVTEYPVFNNIWRNPSGAVDHDNERFTIMMKSGQVRIFKVTTKAE